VGSTKLPAPVITRLNAEVNKMLASDLRDKLLNGQYEPIGGTPQRFAELVRTDMAKYVKAIREAGIKPD
jgi:tripartite-type tricarboxylate transporter receptor subunit TctC